MSSQLEINTSTIQTLLEQINTLPSVSVSSVNGKSGKVALVAADVNAASVEHIHIASEIAEGTFSGAVIANASTQNSNISLIRNSKFVTVDTSPDNNGEICWTYE